MRARKLLPFCLSERKMRASCVITSLQKLVLWGKSLKYHKTYDKNWENWQFVAPQRCLSFRYALLTNKAFPEVYKRCKAILLQQYHYLEEITFPGKDTDCHLLSTTTEMEGPAREKKNLISAESAICYHSMGWEQLQESQWKCHSFPLCISDQKVSQYLVEIGGGRDTIFWFYDCVLSLKEQERLGPPICSGLLWFNSAEAARRPTA